MGSFHRTCIATHTPITYGDDVVGLFVVASGSRSASSGFAIHPTDRWVPVSLPFRGTYDDYGWLEARAEDHGFHVAFDLALAGSALVSDGHRPEDTSTPFPQGVHSLTDTHRMVHDRSVFVPVPAMIQPSQRAHLSVVLCHASAWNLLVAPPADPWEDHTVTVDTLLADADQVLDVALHHLNTKAPLNEESLPRNWEVLATPYVRGGGLKAGRLTLLPTLVLAAVAASEGQTDRALSFLRGLAEIVVANHTLDALNRTWDPAAGAGYDERWDLHLALLDVSRGILEKGMAEALGDDDN